jgi:hypothetical protein
MSDNITLVDTSEIEEKVQKILRQTDYTDEIAREKLKEFNYNEIDVIKSYFGIYDKKPQTQTQIKSVNQEIYRQLRHKLDSNMKDYNIRVEKGEAKRI